MDISGLKNSVGAVGADINSKIKDAKNLAKSAQGAVDGLKAKAGNVINNVTGKTDQSKNTTPQSQIVDSEWLKSTFVIKDSDIVIGDEYSKYIRKNRYFSSADYKFTSTSPGMNMAVNPKPQFTRYCDIRSKGKLQRPDVTVGTTGHHTGLGMGRYYSEAIDDNQQRIFLRFGVPKYMPLLLWMSKSFDIDKVILHNRGVITGTLLEAIGLVSKFLAIGAAPLLAIGMFAVNVYTQNSRFYSVKETMYTYWATVENILNQMTARRTMVPHIFQDYSFKLDNTIGREQKTSQSFVEALNALIPDVIDGETGRISVFAIALRSQAAYNKMLQADYKENEGKNLSQDMTGYPDTGRTSHDTYFTNNRGEANVASKAVGVTANALDAIGNAPGAAVSFTKNLFDKAHQLLMRDNKDQQVSLLDEGGGATQSSMIEYDPAYLDKDGKPMSLSTDPNDPSDSPEQKIQKNAKDKKATFDKYKEYMLAELSEGAAFAVFNVDYTGSVGESFSNSSGSNPIESTFNAISSKARNISNILSSATDIPVVQDVMKFAADTGATILSNASFGIANPLLALAYGVNISMPKVWESSSASLPRANYKIKLISPYGNAYSQLFNIYLPLAMILAGSLPRSTGASSYTSPYMCQLFDRGRVNIQLGMIEQVGITRGTSNLAFSRNGHPNAIDVDISIANLDEVISVDVNSSGVITRALNALSPDFSDNPFTTYLNTITAVDVYTQVYRVPMMRLKLAERAMVLKTITNPDPAAMAAFTVDKIPFTGLYKNLFGNNQAALQDLTLR